MISMSVIPRWDVMVALSFVRFIPKLLDYLCCSLMGPDALSSRESPAASEPDCIDERSAPCGAFMANTPMPMQMQTATTITNTTSFKGNPSHRFPDRIEVLVITHLP
jgi:hypothetical protein